MLSDDAEKEKDMVTAVKTTSDVSSSWTKTLSAGCSTPRIFTLHCIVTVEISFENSEIAQEIGLIKVDIKFRNPQWVFLFHVSRNQQARNRNVTNIISCMLWIVTFYGTVSTTRNFWSDTKQNNSLKTLVWRIPEFCTSMIHYGSWSIMDHLIQHLQMIHYGSWSKMDPIDP